MPTSTLPNPAPVMARENFRLNAEAFSRHLDAEGKSPLTIEAYGKATDQLEAFLRAQGMPLAVSSLTREHVESFLIELRRRGLRPATISQRYRSLQQFFKYLIEEGELRESPLRNISPPRVPDEPPPLIGPDDMRRLLRACAGSGFPDRRDTAIVSLFYDSGIRRAEMAGLRMADLNLGNREMTVIGKGGRPRIVRYGRETARVIDRYLRLRGNHRHADHDHLWLGEAGPLTVYGVEQMIGRRASKAGLPGIHPHTFRHSFADAYLSDGGNEGDLMRLAGWRSRQMVDRYGRSAASGPSPAQLRRP
jgi:site-specific recombinase XerC